MEIQHNQQESKGEFFYEVDGKKFGIMTYSKAGSDKIIIDHTEVDASLKRQGVGYNLVETAVDYARDNKIVILPLCPFAAAVFKKRTDYKDVLG